MEVVVQNATPLEEFEIAFGINKEDGKMKKTNTKFNAFIEELEVLIGKYKEEIGSRNGISSETPPEKATAATHKRYRKITLTTKEVSPSRNQYIQIGDIEIGSRPEIKHEQKSNWWHIDDIEFFH